MDKKLLDLNGVKVYTKADVIDAMNLIGQDVYMSDYADFEHYYKLRLTGIRFEEDLKYAFVGGDYDGTTIIYKYFILAKDAKFKEEKEKTLRPFKSIIEFGWETGCEELGDKITIRSINENYDEECVFNGYRVMHDEKQTTIIYLGCMNYTFQELKDYYLYSKAGEWCPFGIEE